MGLGQAAEGGGLKLSVGLLPAAGKQQAREEKGVDGSQEPDHPQTQSALTEETTENHHWPSLRSPVVSHGSADPAYNLRHLTVPQPGMFHPLVHPKTGVGASERLKEAAKTSGGTQRWEQEVRTAVRPGQGFRTHRHGLRSAPSMTLAKSSQISELRVPLLINGAQSHVPTHRAMKTKGAGGMVQLWPLLAEAFVPGLGGPRRPLFLPGTGRVSGPVLLQPLRVLGRHSGLLLQDPAPHVCLLLRGWGVLVGRGIRDEG